MVNLDLRTLFEFAVHRGPERTAVVEGEIRYTYAQLNDRVNRAASSLQKLGVRKYDRIVVLLKNRLKTVIVFWAVQKLGAVYTPINVRQSEENIHYCLNDVEAKFVIFEESTRHVVMQKNLQEHPLFICIDGQADVTYEELLDSKNKKFKRPELTDEDLAVILYTSGTSGRPKGVPRTHKNEYASTIAHIFQCGYQIFDRTFGLVSLYHTMGLRSLLAMTMLNGSFAILPDFDPYESLRLIEREETTCLYLMPTMYHDLVNHPYVKEIDFSFLRTIVYAGASMSESLINKCDAVFQPKDFINHYGSTEIYTFTTCSNMKKKPGCVGKPGIHQNIKLVKPHPDGKSSPQDIVSNGEIGEIIVHIDSPEAFKGYWNLPESTKEVVREGWYFTGDLGYFDKEGDLFVIGRIDEMILAGGENIYPQEIESVLNEHPKVEEAVVVGEEDERWGQIVTAYIVPSDQSVTIHELDQHCKTNPQLSSFKRPRKYVFLSSVPKTAVGKVMRKQLKNRYFKG